MVAPHAPFPSVAPARAIPRAAMPIAHFSHFHPVALDLGTAWTRIASDEGRHFSTRTERRGVPGVLAGAVADPDTCAEILQDLFRTVRPLSPFARRLAVVATLSPSASPGERQALISTLYRSGASSVSLIPQPIAAALGAGLEPASEYAHLVVDVGDGFTEYSVIRAGKVEVSEAVKVGCGAIGKAIAAHAPHLDGQQTRELLRWLGTHRLGDAEGGRNVAAPVDGLSGELLEELWASLDDTCDFLVQGALQLFRQLPDRTACEVIENGLTLVGGGAMIRELRLRFAERTGLQVRAPANPLTAIIEGAVQVLPYASVPGLLPEENYKTDHSPYHHGFHFQSRAEHSPFRGRN